MQGRDWVCAAAVVLAANRQAMAAQLRIMIGSFPRKVDTIPCAASAEHFVNGVDGSTGRPSYSSADSQ